MTLKELINKSSYKKVFNILYKEFYMEKSVEEVNNLDLCYLNAWNELKSKKESNSSSGIEIHLSESKEDGKEVFDVNLYKKSSDSFYATDYVAWSDIIGSEIKKPDSLSEINSLAHILREITFYGFTESEISKSKLKLMKEFSKDFQK